MNISCKLRASFLFEVAFVLDFVCGVLCMKNKVTHSVHYITLITDCMPLLHSHKQIWFCQLTLQMYVT